MVFRSPDGWLSKRSWVSDWRTPENGSESPSLSDQCFSHSPSMAYPLAGCFVSANLLKLRHLCRFSVCRYSPAEKGEKAVSVASPDVFLRLKRPPTFPLTRQFPPRNGDFLRFFLNSVVWISRERRRKSSPQRNRE